MPIASHGMAYVSPLLPSPKRTHFPDHRMNLDIVYLTYDITGNNPWLYSETLFSALTLLGCLKRESITTARIRIFTDAPTRFRLLTNAVSVVPLMRDRIVQGMGPHRFIHRLKLDLLLDQYRNSNSTLLYCDGDTLFTGPIGPYLERISPSASLMHALEVGVWTGPDRQLRHMRRHLSHDPSHPLYVPPGAIMFNAGIIGISPAHVGCLHDAIRFTDAATCLARSHTWEQLAISVAIGRRTTIVDSQSMVRHYWAYRRVYSAAVSRRLDDLQAANASLDMAIAAAETPLTIQGDTPPSIVLRLFRKITGRSRSPSLRLQDAVRRMTNSG